MIRKRDTKIFKSIGFAKLSAGCVLSLKVYPAM